MIVCLFLRACWDEQVDWCCEPIRRLVGLVGWLVGWLAWLVGLPNFLHFSPPSPQDELHDGLTFCIFVSD